MNLNASQRKEIKSAGWLYLLLVVSAPIGLLYVPGELIVWNDAAATAGNLRNSEWLLRLGIGSELFHQAVVIYLALVLYRLFKPVNKPLAVQVVVLGGLIPVPIMFLNVASEIAAALLASGPEYLSAFEQQQRDALALLFLRLHENGTHIAAIFWGLWLFPLGTLGIRCGFIPRIFGFLLYFAGVSYLGSSTTALVLPAYKSVVGDIAMVLAMFELPFAAWFIYKGIRITFTGTSVKELRTS